MLGFRLFSQTNLAALRSIRSHERAAPNSVLKFLVRVAILKYPTTPSSFIITSAFSSSCFSISSLPDSCLITALCSSLSNPYPPTSSLILPPSLPNPLPTSSLVVLMHPYQFVRRAGTISPSCEAAEFLKPNQPSMAPDDGPQTDSRSVSMMKVTNIINRATQHQSKHRRTHRTWMETFSPNLQR